MLGDTSVMTINFPELIGAVDISDGQLASWKGEMQTSDVEAKLHSRDLVLSSALCSASESHDTTEH